MESRLTVPVGSTVTVSSTWSWSPLALSALVTPAASTIAAEAPAPAAFDASRSKFEVAIEQPRVTYGYTTKGADAAASGAVPPFTVPATKPELGVLELPTT